MVATRVKFGIYRGQVFEFMEIGGVLGPTVGVEEGYDVLQAAFGRILDHRIGRNDTNAAGDHDGRPLWIVMQGKGARRNIKQDFDPDHAAHRHGGEHALEGRVAHPHGDDQVRVSRCAGEREEARVACLVCLWRIDQRHPHMLAGSEPETGWLLKTERKCLGGNLSLGFERDVETGAFHDRPAMQAPHALVIHIRLLLRPGLAGKNLQRYIERTVRYRTVCSKTYC
jgi:hypothetical protein